MAKRNVFLSTATGKVGSIVLYRRNGEQIVRTHVSSIANPKTAAQSLQRAYFAPVSKFYAPLSTCLEKSFEGQNKSESATSFRKEGINDARTNNWLLPKGTGFFPLPYKLSQGTIQPVSCAMADHVVGITSLAAISESNPVPTTVGQLSALFIAAGYLAGDQVTFIVVARDADKNYFPDYARFILAPDSTVTLAEAMPNIDFNADSVADVSRLCFSMHSQFDTFAGACIISRYGNEKWRRSTQRLIVHDGIMEEVTSAEMYERAVTSYMNGGSVVTSNVYLNGSTGSNAANVSAIALNDGTAVTLGALEITAGDAAVVHTFSGNNLIRANVKIGSDYLLTETTKGAMPSTGEATTQWLDGTNAAVKSYLMDQGVAASVFQ